MEEKMTKENTTSNKYVLAMYDVRGKQNFIFQSQKLKEIIGGSAIIRDVYNTYLFSSAKEYGNNKGIYSYTEKDNKDNNAEISKDFSVDEFERHLSEGYIGEVIYDGGGNFYVLFESEEIFKEVTYRFTKKVLEEIGTLKVVGTYVEIDNFNDFKKDEKRLREKHAKNESMESVIAPWGTLPIVQVDKTTSLPIVSKEKIENRDCELSLVSKRKNDKYIEEKNNNKEIMGEKILDKMVTEKGKESLLAVVYIDGNSMRAKVQACTENTTTYVDSINALRNFSSDIQRDYVDNRIKEIDDAILKGETKIEKRRIVVHAGDEINFICNARDAFTLVNTYLKGLPKEKEASACAGIAIFHSHAPYADAYKIAEECCESGKKKMKELGLSNSSFVDFHYCQGAIDVSLDKIREDEDCEDISRPWLICASDDEENIVIEKGMVTIDDVNKTKEFLNMLGRSNVKGLAEAAKDGYVNLLFELERIKAHRNSGKRETEEEKKKFEEKYKEIKSMDKEKMRKLIYDMVLVFDLWFDDKKEVKSK